MCEGRSAFAWCLHALPKRDRGSAKARPFAKPMLLVRRVALWMLWYGTYRVTEYSTDSKAERRERGSIWPAPCTFAFAKFCEKFRDKWSSTWHPEVHRYIHTCRDVSMKASARPPDAVDKHLKRGNRETERERERESHQQENHRWQRNAQALHRTCSPDFCMIAEVCVQLMSLNLWRGCDDLKIEVASSRVPSAHFDAYILVCMY